MLARLGPRLIVDWDSFDLVSHAARPSFLPNLQQKERQETEAHQAHQGAEGHKLKELQEQKEPPLEPKALIQETTELGSIDLGDRLGGHTSAPVAKGLPWTRMSMRHGSDMYHGSI